MAWLQRTDVLTSATGPYDRWLTPRLEMSWRPSTAPINEPIAKLGGQPFWLGEPFWPVSRVCGEPMMFVGQFPLPGSDVAMAYLFISDLDDSTDAPEGGENALIVQPAGRVPPFLTGEARATGPTLWRRGAEWTQRVPVELHLDLQAPAESVVSAYERKIVYEKAARRGIWLEDGSESADVACRSYVGGEPLLWQPWAPLELDDSWRFFFQLDGAEGWGEDAFALNFGGGTGFAFLSQDQRGGRFFWDCV